MQDEFSFYEKLITTTQPALMRAWEIAFVGRHTFMYLPHKKALLDDKLIQNYWSDINVLSQITNLKDLWLLRVPFNPEKGKTWLGNHADIMFEYVPNTENVNYFFETKEAKDLRTGFSIKEKQKEWIVQSKELSNDRPTEYVNQKSSTQFLLNATKRLYLNLEQLNSIRQVASTIAFLDKKMKIDVEHIAEAIIYQSINPTDYEL